MMLSVIIPVFNEGPNLPALRDSLVENLELIGHPFEVIVVNDGSTDATERLLGEMSRDDPRFKVVNFRRNFGQTAAVMAGIDYSHGEIIIPMDGDLQNDPSDMKLLLDKLDAGFDVVSGWRKSRKDHKIRRNLLSGIANRLISFVSGVRLHDYGCTLKAYRREVLQDVKLYGEMHRFIPIYASWQGARVTEVPVKHHPRTRGRSNYGLERILKVLLDLVVVKFLARNANNPIYVFGGFGLLNIGIAFAAGIAALYLKFFAGISFISTPLPLLTVMAFITGVMSILMGLLAEIIMRTYYEAQGKPVYLVKNTFNLGEHD